MKREPRRERERETQDLRWRGSQDKREMGAMWRMRRLQVKAMGISLLRIYEGEGISDEEVEDEASAGSGDENGIAGCDEEDEDDTSWGCRAEASAGSGDENGIAGCDEEDENERDGNCRARWELLRIFCSNHKNPNAYSHAPFDASDGSRSNGWSDEATASDFLCSLTA
ncbi:hypothetical protein ACLOJK_022079 [Asimina triloba]